RASAAFTIAGVASFGWTASRVGKGAAWAGIAKEPRTTAGIAAVATALPRALTRLLCARDMERSFGLGQGRIVRSQLNAHDCGLCALCESRCGCDYCEFAPRHGNCESSHDEIIHMAPE